MAVGQLADLTVLGRIQGRTGGEMNDALAMVGQVGNSIRESCRPVDSNQQA